MSDDLLDAIRVAFHACDQDRVNSLLILAAATGDADAAEQELQRALAEATCETRTWWLGECNCDGHLN